MAEEKQPTGKRPARYALKDIAPVLDGWAYEPGTINVRKIIGLDGEPKLQMRLELGLFQMEVTGRPDGTRPHGYESLLEYHQKRLDEYRHKHGNAMGFHLTEAQCQSLREEAMLYYHRYLSLFVLGEFQGVALDTDRNLRVIDLCGRYGVTDHDRLVLEQYRPYILMMNTRACASIEVERENYPVAYRIVRRGLRDIRKFFERFGQPQAFKQANEARVLRRFAREIKQKLPIDPVRELQKQLDRAVKEERYEEAARLRDELERITPPPPF